MKNPFKKRKEVKAKEETFIHALNKEIERQDTTMAKYLDINSILLTM